MKFDKRIISLLTTALVMSSLVAGDTCEFQITRDTDYQWSPEIYGDIVVWTDWRDIDLYQTFNLEVFGYDLSAGRVFQITKNPNMQCNAAIYGDIVVFEDDRNGNVDIYGVNLSTQEEFQITTDPNSQILPQIYEDTVVWIHSENKIWDIYGVNLSTGEEFLVAEDIQGIPAIYGDIVVCKREEMVTRIFTG